MPDYTVTARQYGNSIQFEIEAVDTKSALGTAKVEARSIFDYSGQGDEPTVSVKEIKEKE